MTRQRTILIVLFVLFAAVGAASTMLATSTEGPDTGRPIPPCTPNCRTNSDCDIYCGVNGGTCGFKHGCPQCACYAH